MININPIRDIRTCQRIKFTQAIYILTMYEKKIRLPIDKSEEKILDADEELDKIIHAWNNKWKMDLTKPVLNSVISVHPLVYLGEGETEFNKYNNLMKDFIKRLREEHEDETNYKLIQKNMKTEKEIDKEPFKRLSQISIQDCINCMKGIIGNMIQSVDKSTELAEQRNFQTEKFSKECFESMLGNLQIFEETQEQKDSFSDFTSILMKIMENIKESEHGATLMAPQPDINNLTHLLHPIFPAIYGHLWKQKENQEFKGEMKKQSYESYKNKFIYHMENKMKDRKEGSFFKEIFKSSSNNFSKVAFINLDGYESEFNLQFARCFRKNLLYISFPKEDVHAQNDQNSDFEKRLYKKIMYNYEKNKLNENELDLDDELDERAKEVNEKYALENNYENYFQNVEKELYSFDKGYQDLNKNIFIFPLRLPSFNDNFTNFISEDHENNVDISESHLIYQIFWYFMISQIRQFCPTFIIISHSGRLKIEDSHFVQIMQELTKLSNYKLIYFPNLTAQYSTFENVDHLFRNDDINFEHKENGQMANETQVNLSFNFFNKIMRFLKVASGTHNLTRLFEEESLLSKFKNQLVLSRMNRLMEALGCEYENVEKMRFKDRDIEFIPKIYEEDIKKILRDEIMQRLIPKFYSNLYDCLNSLIALEEKQLTETDEMRINQFKVDFERYRNEVKEVVYFMKEKYSVREIKEKKERQRKQYEKLLEYIKSYRDRHFIDISEQKYEEEFLFYFKLFPENEIYKQIKIPEEEKEKQTMQNYLNGLAEVSFSYPFKQMKQKLQIFQTASVLYKIDQSKSTNNYIPVLIMNYLSSTKNWDCEKFHNFAALLDKRQMLPNQNKIVPYKDIKVLPLKLMDHDNNEIVENVFKFRTQWNYVETERYIILYWPSLYDFILAICYKIQGIVYEPKILNEIFILDKETFTDKSEDVRFLQSNIPDGIQPRYGCSAYEINSQIYLFGGFYSKQKNYLNLQRDITRLDLRNYDHTGHRKVLVFNMKENLYGEIERQRKPNSYVRARRQFEFYDMKELKEGFVEKQGERTVVMIGGYGQNFIRPFSLLTYYYYVLKFEKGNLLKIQKKLIYDKTLLINTKESSKNLGIIKTSTRSRNQKNESLVDNSPKLTQLDSECRFRCSYAFRQANNTEELHFKYKYLFSEKDLKMMKEALKNFQDHRHESNELSNVSIRLEKIENINNMVFMQRYNSKKMVPLRLVLNKDEVEKEFQLTQQSVCYLSIINGIYICAIVKHPIYTENKSIIVQCTVKSIEKDAISEDDKWYINLKEIKQITDFKPEADLSLHIIEASNKNFIFLLHGYQLFQSSKIKEYQIKNPGKQGKKAPTSTKINPNPKRLKDLDNKIRSCFSTFFYKKGEGKQEIICESYLSIEDTNTIILIEEKFQPSSIELIWKFPQEEYKYRQFQFGINKPLPLEKLKFIDIYKNENQTLILVQYNKKKYTIMFGGKAGEEYVEEVQMKECSQEDLRKIDESDMEKGTILVKKPEHYVDRQFIQS